MKDKYTCEEVKEKTHFGSFSKLENFYIYLFIFKEPLNHSNTTMFH